MVHCDAPDGAIFRHRKRHGTSFGISGYRVKYFCIANNFACKYGEIDLIMRQGDALVFVEVRFRKHVQYGTGAESVDYRKQQKLLKCAEYFLQRNTKYNQYPCRIDVVSIGLKKPNATEDSTPTIDWIPNAIES